MLITRISVNWSGIEDILIHNTAELDDKGNTKYEIMNPKNPDERLIPDIILHKRNKGYRPLLIKVLRILESKKIQTKTLD